MSSSSWSPAFRLVNRDNHGDRVRLGAFNSLIAVNNTRPTRSKCKVLFVNHDVEEILQHGVNAPDHLTV